MKPVAQLLWWDRDILMEEGRRDFVQVWQLVVVPFTLFKRRTQGGQYSFSRPIENNYLSVVLGVVLRHLVVYNPESMDIPISLWRTPGVVFMC
jgi:hypothetical protein